MLFIISLLIGIFLISAIILGGLLKNPSDKILGIYSRPGRFYFLKYALAKFLFTMRQKRSNKQKIVNKPNVEEDLMNSNLVKSTTSINTEYRSEINLEAKHCLPEDAEWAADCIYFNGSNSNGWYINLGMAQRQNNTINLFFALRIPNLGIFVNEEMAKTTNVQSIPCERGYKTKSGFLAICLEPMKKWQIKFSGKLIRAENLKQNFEEIGQDDEISGENPQLIDANFDLEWINQGEYFDFDIDISPQILAHSLAIEPWSREMFERLRSTHQTHYEQFGRLSGSFSIGQKFNSGPNEFISMRDHTITKFRKWTQIRRYIILIYHLEDGTCIHTSLISMPEIVFSHLQFGYLITKEKKKLAVDSINLHLSEIGENKNFPQKFSYSFCAGQVFYMVQVKILDYVKFKMGLELACYVQENFCEFLVNDIKGFGFAEIEYRINPY